MNEWHCFADTGKLDQALAAHIAQRLANDIKLQGQASLAVSGGSTPIGMFRQLARWELDWSRVWITLADERCVANDHRDSNERLLRENLLQQQAQAARFISLANYRDNDLAELERQIGTIPRPFSVVVLGMGGDGHTASWFPASTNLQALLDPANPRLIAETEPVTAPHRRITLTLAAVLNSGEILIHITGTEKKNVLESALAENYPVAAILRQDRVPTAIWWAPEQATQG